MRPLSSLAPNVIGFFSAWQFFLFLGAMWILIVSFREKRRMNLRLRNVLLILLAMLHYSLYQFTVGYTSGKMESPRLIAMTTWYVSLPIVLIAAVYGLQTVVEISFITSIRRWYRTHITSGSVKEAVETLPVGICADEQDGRILLKNRMMERLCRSLTGFALLNGNEYAQALTREKTDLADFVVELPELGTWGFTLEQLQGKESSFTLLIAYNVTEEYQKTQMLAEKRRTVQELNARLTEYNRRIESIITAQEILGAKIRIHDELGSGLLSIRRYLLSGGTEQERRELLERLSRNIEFLQQEAVPEPENEYALMLSTAEALGVKVYIRGTLPETEPDRHIIATAIHECMTNILRHTDGDTLYLTVAGQTAEFSDNNTKPVEEIAEKGGLCSLRSLIEQAGGTMAITSRPRFRLTITLPKERDRYEMSSSDRR